MKKTLVAIVAVLLLAGCGVSPAQHESLQEDYNSLRERYNGLKEDYSSLNASYNGLKEDFVEVRAQQVELNELRDELTLQESSLRELEEQLDEKEKSLRVPSWLGYIEECLSRQGDYISAEVTLSRGELETSCYTG